MLGHFEYISNHGTAQGIWPRFFLQFIDLGQMAFGDQQMDAQSEQYLDVVMPEITNLYDLHEKLTSLIADYLKGYDTGKNYTINAQGTIIINREAEGEIKSLTKDFLIRAKIVTTNFVKCGIIDKVQFDLDGFFRCDNKKFVSHKQQLISQNSIFLPLMDLLEDANNDFLRALQSIRGTIEHEVFSFPKFEILISDNKATASEPILNGKVLSVLVNEYYHKTLQFIEKMFIYYAGIIAEKKTNGFLRLHEDTVFDYSAMEYKYSFAFGNTPSSLTSVPCSYKWL